MNANWAINGKKPVSFGFGFLACLRHSLQDCRSCATLGSIIYMEIYVRDAPWSCSRQ